jgi:hypothetical protein
MIEIRNKLKGRKNLLTLAVAGAAAATAFAATPASAAFFRWCGFFDPGTEINPSNGKIDGTIEVDDVTGVFIKLLENETSETAAFINPITYTTANYIAPPKRAPVLVVAADDDNPFEVFRYIFIQGPNELQVNIPSSWFPNNFPAIGDPPILIGNREIRNGTPRIDPDKVFQVPPPVPGPLPIFGAAAAFGLSRNIRKRIKSASF